MNQRLLDRNSKKVLSAVADIELAKRHYVNYCWLVHHGLWYPGRHHRLIAEKLEGVLDGRIKRLMVWMPPRHGKSMQITETFPSYFLGKNPDMHVIGVSYNDEFAEKFGLANRTKISEYGPSLFGIDISDEKGSKTNWNIAGRRGGMLSVGLGGAITGEGADLLIIDDPVKNRVEAESATYRNKLFSAYQSNIYTRVQRRGPIIIVMTRWHQDDLCGMLLNKEYCDPEEWDIVNLPAVCDSENDQLGRKIGETLWPEMDYDAEWATQTKAAVGTYTWAGLYQQRPSPPEGGLIKREFFKFYEELPSRFDTLAQSWDCTFKEADNNDFVAGHVWGRTRGDYFLVDRVHARMGIQATMQAIKTLTAKWPNARAKYIEEAANGAAVIELLKREVPGLLPVHPQGGKVVRAQAVIPFMESGNVYLPSPKIAPWVHDFIEECVNFPFGAHDDDVDAMTQGINQLASKPTYSAPPANYGNDRVSPWRS